MIAQFLKLDFLRMKIKYLFLIYSNHFQNEMYFLACRQ